MRIQAYAKLYHDTFHNELENKILNHKLDDKRVNDNDKYNHACFQPMIKNVNNKSQINVMRV